MIEAAIQLVADPFRRGLLGQQVCRRADLVVEIDEAFARLGVRPGMSEPVAERERGIEPGSQIDQRAHFLHAAKVFDHAGLTIGIGRFVLLNFL